MVLAGGEVKSIKTGQASIKEAFISIDRGEAWVWNMHVPRWQHSGGGEYDPIRQRKVLLHAGELEKLAVKIKEKGVTLVP